MPLEKNAGARPCFLQCCQRSRCGHDPTRWKPSRRHERSRNPASLAVALNCGFGSSSLNAEVNALLNLHIVRLSDSVGGLHVATDSKSQWIHHEASAEPGKGRPRSWPLSAPIARIVDRSMPFAKPHRQSLTDLNNTAERTGFEDDESIGCSRDG